MDPLSHEIEVSNDKWIEGVKSIPDPYLSLKSHQNRNKVEQKTGFFSNIFGGSLDEKKTQDSPPENEGLIIDSSPLDDMNKVKGIYMYGGPGSGKTFMMDLFYSQVGIENKRRASYTSFVLQIHKMNHANHSKKILDPLFKTSLDVARQYRLFCFDEVQVTEVGDAILMKRFFDAMWKLKVVLVVVLA